MAGLQAELKRAGLVDPRTLLPTENGRAGALKLLRLEALPQNAQWESLLDQFLYPVNPKQANEVSRPAQLLLIRLLAVGGNKAPAFGVVAKGLDPALPAPLTAEAFKTLQLELKQAGLLDGQTLLPTDAGRTEALALLGIRELPEGTTWKALESRYLFALAAGLSPEQAEAAAADPAPFLVKRHFGLESVASSKFPDILDALACKELGHPEIQDLQKLRATVLSRALKFDEVLENSEIEVQLPRVILNVPSTRPDDLRRAMIQRWVIGEPASARHQPTAKHDHVKSEHPHMAHPKSDSTSSSSSHQKAESSQPAQPPAAAPSPVVHPTHAVPSFDLPAFATRIKRIARTSPPTARFGDNKLFISHAWQLFNDESDDAGMDLASFKHRLVEAHRAGLLVLTRADLVSAMNPDDVRGSQTKYLHAEFHFVLIEGA